MAFEISHRIEKFTDEQTDRWTKPITIYPAVGGV